MKLFRAFVVSFKLIFPSEFYVCARCNAFTSTYIVCIWNRLFGMIVQFTLFGSKVHHFRLTICCTLPPITCSSVMEIILQDLIWSHSRCLYQTDYNGKQHMLWVPVSYLYEEICDTDLKQHVCILSVWQHSSP
mgnify:CR=1 FL=1